MKLAFALIIALLLCGCKSVPKSDWQPRVSRAAATYEAEATTVTAPTIIRFQAIPVRPSSDWTCYDTAGRLQGFVSSNACVTAMITYVSNASCWLWHNSRPEGARTNYFSSNPHNNVMLPGFVRVSGELPAGENTITVPLVRDTTGFFTLRTTQ